MSRLVIWLIKLKYKRKVKEIAKSNNISEKEAFKLILKSKNIDYSKKIRLANILMATSLLNIVIGVIIVITVVTGFNLMVSSIAGNTISNLLTSKGDTEDEDNEDGWSWDKVESGNSNVESSGGLYPKDKKLRLRAELLEILAKSSKDAESEKGTKVEPAWILGTIYRETGNSLYAQLNVTSISSLYKDLVIANPACGKGICVYNENGHSHFYGGSVSGGIDKGDPYKQVIDTSASLYQNMGGDHAIGYLQFEVPYIYGTLTKLYGDPTPIIKGSDPSTVQSQVKNDKELGFIRPNQLYIPDAMYNGAFRLANKPTITSSNYSNIIQSSDFKKLSEYNQNFIKFVYASAGYGRGNITSSDDEMALALIKIANSGAIENLDDMLKEVSNKYWDSSSMISLGSRDSVISYVNSKYGINIPSDRVAWYGVYAGLIGKVAYNEMSKAIEKAEKDGPANGGTTNGNWVGKPGSGKFGNNGSKYYLDKIGIRWYYQTSQVTTNSETWGSLYLDPNSTMAEGGCGIYTLAMIASNLYNKDITPNVALAALEGKYQVGCLTDAGVLYLAGKLGLQVKTINYTSSDAIDRIYKALDKGNMILFVSQYYDAVKFPWYTGDGHFMAIRGKTDDGKLLVVSSVGNYRAAGLSPEQVMSMPLDPQTVIDSLGRNRNYFWEVGLKVE